MVGKVLKYIKTGREFLINETVELNKRLNNVEVRKTPYRYDIINYIFSSMNRPTTYLEIGVRNPEDNFNKINATTKYSVDPGIEFKENPVDFKLMSDAFFDALRKGEVLSKDTLFDVIFIDGLHLAEQVDRDIENALEFIKEDGFIVLHDCNPPTEWNAREDFNFIWSPAGGTWNGTTWKAFLKWRYVPIIHSCCIDTDWGVGIISKTKFLGESPKTKNPFYEFNVLQANRVDQLNLLPFEEFKQRI